MFSKVSGRRQLLVPFGQDPFGPAFELVLGRQVIDPPVEPDLIVLPDKLADDPPGVLQRQRGSGANALDLQGLMPPFYLSITLWIRVQFSFYVVLMRNL